MRDLAILFIHLNATIAKLIGVEIDSDIVRRVLAKHFRPDPDANGPSWLTLLGHSRDSLWSIDLFRCESLILKSHWVLVVMDQFTRRIIGFGIHAGTVDGPVLCRMFGQAIRGSGPPKYVSSDNDPLFRFHRWKANLRILEVTEVKTVPHVPLSHPFVERLIGTVRREYLDHVPFWSTSDLRKRLHHFKKFYNHQRCHYALDGETLTAKNPEDAIKGCRSAFLLLAESLPRPLSFACRGLTSNSPHTSFRPTVNNNSVIPYVFHGYLPPVPRDVCHPVERSDAWFTL